MAARKFKPRRSETGREGAATVSSATLAHVPRKPTAVFCGKLMTREFTDGAYALRDTLPEIEPYDDEHAAAALILACIDRLLESNQEAARGAIAALAHFAVVSQGGTLCDVSEWTPLEIVAYCNDEGESTPHPMSTYFNVGGEPVSITPDLVALRWTAYRSMPSQSMSIDVVRMIGKPISRKRFDAMRAALAADQRSTPRPTRRGTTDRP